MPKRLRLLIVFAAPIFVGIVNLFHPVHFGPTGVYDALAPLVSWWITLHVLNLIGFSLLGLAAYLLLADLRHPAATVTRVALAIFVPVYAAFDAIIGIGTGALVQYAASQPAALDVLRPAIDSFWSAPTAYALAAVGSALWGVSLAAAAIALAGPKRRLPLIVVGVASAAVPAWGQAAGTFGSPPWWIAVVVVYVAALAVAGMPSALLLAAGMLFGTTHVTPYGPLAMACFVVAAALIELPRLRLRSPKPTPALT